MRMAFATLLVLAPSWSHAAPRVTISVQWKLFVSSELWCTTEKPRLGCASRGLYIIEDNQHEVVMPHGSEVKCRVAGFRREWEFSDRALKTTQGRIMRMIRCTTDDWKTYAHATATVVLGPERAADEAGQMACVTFRQKEGDIQTCLVGEPVYSK